MKPFKIFLTFLIFYSSVTNAQDLKPEYQKFISKFILEVKNGNKEEVAKMVKYPFRRDYPIPQIKNKADFVKRYDEIFDEELKNEIVKSNPAKNWDQVGWRGIMLNSGTIWFEEDGKLRSINHVSKKEEAYKQKLIAKDKSNLHLSIKSFKEPVAVLETSKFRIRIDDLGNGNYRYVSWSIKQKMSDKPDLIIEKGVIVADGTGGNHYYEFKKGNFTYVCDFIVLGQKGAPPARLVVSQSGKEILSQNAKIVPR